MKTLKKYRPIPKIELDELEIKLIKLETFYRNRYGHKGFKSDRSRFRILGRHIDQIRKELRSV